MTTKKRDEAEVALLRWMKAGDRPGDLLGSWRKAFKAGFEAGRAARGEGTRTVKAWATIYDEDGTLRFVSDPHTRRESIRVDFGTRIVRATVTYKAPKSKRSKKP